MKLPGGADYDEMVAEIAKREPLIRSLVKQWHRRDPLLDVDDISGSVRAAFWEAATRFDSGRGAAFATYACHWARAWLKELCYYTHGRGMGVAWREVSATTLRVVQLDECTAESIPAREPVGMPEFSPNFWQLVAAALDQREAAVVSLHYREGLTLRECGARIGVTKQRAQQIEAGALKKLQAFAAAIKAA